MQDAKWDFCTLNWRYYWAQYDFFSYVVRTTMVVTERGSASSDSRVRGEKYSRPIVWQYTDAASLRPLEQAWKARGTSGGTAAVQCVYIVWY